MSHDSSSTDPKHSKQHDTSGTATKDDVQGIFTAINAIAEKVDTYKSSTTELINAFSDRLTSLEKDLAEGSTADTNELNTGKIGSPSDFPPLASLLSTQSSSFTTTTVTTSHNRQPSKRFLESEEEPEDDTKKPKRKNLKRRKNTMFLPQVQIHLLIKIHLLILKCKSLCRNMKLPNQSI